MQSASNAQSNEIARLRAELAELKNSSPHDMVSTKPAHNRDVEGQPSQNNRGEVVKTVKNIRPSKSAIKAQRAEEYDRQMMGFRPNASRHPVQIKVKNSEGASVWMSGNSVEELRALRQELSGFIGNDDLTKHRSDRQDLFEDEFM